VFSLVQFSSVREAVRTRYRTSGVGKRVRGTSLYHSRQCCIVLKHAQIAQTTHRRLLYRRMTAAENCENGSSASLKACVAVVSICNQIKETIPATTTSYVRNIYGKHVVTDEPLDYVQQSVRCDPYYLAPSVAVALRLLSVRGIAD